MRGCGWPAPPGSQSDDEEAVLATMGRYMLAISANDLRAMAEFLTAHGACPIQCGRSSPTPETSYGLMILQRSGPRQNPESGRGSRVARFFGNARDPRGLKPPA